MIKKLIVIVLVLLNVASVYSQQQTLFVDKKYDDALAMSRTLNKPLVIMFYASWCPHCNVMKKDIFTDTTVADFYNTYFVCMAVDAESAYGKELRAKFQQKFRINSFPTFTFFDVNESLLYCTAGEFKKEKFLSEGKDVLLPENQLPTIRAAFLSDISNADKCLKYIVTVRKAGFDATAIAQKFLSTVKPEDKITEINWKVFSNGINNFDTDEFRFLVENKDAFAKVASPSRVDKKIAYTITETLKPLVEKVDTINYAKKRLVAESFRMRKVDSLLYRFDLQIIPQTSNWKQYQKTTAENVEKFSWKDPVVLYDICNTYNESVTDKKGLLRAVEWSNHLLAMGESNDRYVITTKLLMKLKEYKKALEFAQKGKNFAESLGLKSEEINKLLIEIKKYSN